MSDYTFLALAIIVNNFLWCVAGHYLLKGLRRRDLWLAKLTRRVWILEGSPPCDCSPERPCDGTTQGFEA